MEATTLYEFSATSGEELSFPAGAVIKVDAVNSSCFCILCFSLYVSFGQGSILLWTHMLRPFYSRPIALTQEMRSQVDDVCECVHD